MMESAVAADVFVCQQFEAVVPLAAAWRDLADLERELQPHCAWVQTLLMSVDGRRLLWHLRAQEQRGIEAALGWARTEAAAGWPVTIREMGSKQPANVVVEHSDHPRPPPTPLRGDLQELCLLSHRVEAVREVVSADGRTRLSFYHAPDTDSVRFAQRHGAVPDGRVWSFRVVG